MIAMNITKKENRPLNLKNIKQIRSSLFNETIRGLYQTKF